MKYHNFKVGDKVRLTAEARKATCSRDGFSGACQRLFDAWERTGTVVRRQRNITRSCITVLCQNGKTVSAHHTYWEAAR